MLLERTAGDREVEVRARVRLVAQREVPPLLRVVREADALERALEDQPVAAPVAGDRRMERGRARVHAVVARAHVHAGVGEPPAVRGDAGAQRAVPGGLRLGRELDEREVDGAAAAVAGAMRDVAVHERAPLVDPRVELALHLLVARVTGPAIEVRDRARGPVAVVDLQPVAAGLQAALGTVQRAGGAAGEDADRLAVAVDPPADEVVRRRVAHVLDDRGIHLVERDELRRSDRERHQGRDHAVSSARAKSSASNGRRSSSCSPIPISLTGMPSSLAIASAMPPLAVPSSLVSTIPVTPTASPNSLAWRTPFWPVVASTVISVSCGASGICLAITRRTLVSSAISSVCVCRRPAVSTITTSAPRSRPRATASKATAPGSEPSGPLTTSTPARSPQRSSCSTAAARNVSAAPITTSRSSVLRRCQASLPIVVVLPVPLTPTTRITVGAGRMSILSSPVRASWASSSARRPVSGSPPARPPSSASRSSFSTTCAVVRAPTSA